MLNKPVAAAAAAIALLSAIAAPACAEPVKNIVLVHGAFADGSGWQRVADILGKDGYTVSFVQEPLTSLADDAAAKQQPGQAQPAQPVRYCHQTAQRSK